MSVEMIGGVKKNIDEIIEEAISLKEIAINWKEFLEEKERREKLEAAATKIQAQFRGFLVRKRLNKIG